MTPVAYFFGLGLLLYFSHGMFEAALVVPLLAAQIAYTQTVVQPPPSRSDGAGARDLLAAGLVGSTLFMAHGDALYYAIPTRRERLDELLQLLALLAIVSAVASQWLARSAGRTVFFAATLGVILVCALAHAWVIYVSPSPSIDVWTSSQRAVDYLLHGKNPYPQPYEDIYHGRYDYRPGMPYWPGYLLWATAGVIALPSVHDVRVSLVGAEALLCFFLYGLLRQAGVTRSLAVLAVAAWLAFPIGLFLVEQAFIDPLLLACFAGAAWALAARRGMLAGIALGFACATKQYALFGAVLAVIYAARALGWRGAARVAAATAVVATALIAPFAAGAPAEFWRSSIRVPATILPRLDALTFPAWVAHKWPPANIEALQRLYAAYAWLALAVFALAAAWLATRRRPSIAQYFQATAVAYGFMLILAKQAFCNYYYFLAFFVLAAGCASLGGSEAGAAAPHDAAPDLQPSSASSRS
jgi:hypothetical protein